MSEKSNPPKGWCYTSLEIIATWGSGGTPSRSQERYFQGNIPWIKTGELENKYIREAEEHITEEALNNSSTKIFPKGSVGIAMYGATIGKLSIWGIDASTNQACAVGIPSEAINNEFLYYYLLSERQSLIKAGKGGAQPNLSQGIIKEWPINLPPLPEQHRIVAKIEELFSELDSGLENLKTARAQLKVYRQALLKHAFEGKLTAQWRAENQGKLETAEALLKRIQHERAERYQQQLADFGKSPSIPLLQRGKTISAANILPVEKKELEKSDDSPLCKRGARGDFKPKAPKSLPPLTAEELAELPKLPEGWGWVKVDSYCEAERNSIKAGPFGSSLKKEFYVNEGYKVYGQEQVISGDWKYGDYFIDEARYLDLESCKVKPFDILISLVGTLGKVLVLPENITPGVINPRLVKISPNLNAVVPEFFKYYFESSFLKGLYKLKTHGATMDVLNLGIIQELPFPICSLKEQKFLIQEIEARLSEVDQLELTITTSLQQAEALRQSILKKAFSGQLVPQDPHDEPASKLLERIKAERAKSPHPPFAKGGRSRSGGGISAKPRKTAKGKA